LLKDGSFSLSLPLPQAAALLSLAATLPRRPPSTRTSPSSPRLEPALHAPWRSPRGCSQIRHHPQSLTRIGHLARVTRERAKRHGSPGCLRRPGSSGRQLRPASWLLRVVRRLPSCGVIHKPATSLMPPPSKEGWQQVRHKKKKSSWSRAPQPP
jgi:hypothetical protein